MKTQAKEISCAKLSLDDPFISFPSQTCLSPIPQGLYPNAGATFRLRYGLYRKCAVYLYHDRSLDIAAYYRNQPTKRRETCMSHKRRDTMPHNIASAEENPTQRIKAVNIGTVIARLRKKNCMTQEDLSTVLGVSPQTISKWENSTTMPDIMLLPLLADTFGVTMEELFGGESKVVKSQIGFNEIPAAAHEGLIDLMLQAFSGKDDSAGDENQRMAKANIMSGARSLIYSDDGEVTWVSGKLGLIVRNVGGGMLEQAESDEAVAVLKAFADDSVRAIFHLTQESSVVRFTQSSISKKLNLTPGEVGAAVELLCRFGLLETQELQLDDDVVKTYHGVSGGAYGLLYAMFTCAAEVGKEENRHLYCGYRG